jgi:hypothetical protein
MNSILLYVKTLYSPAHVFENLIEKPRWVFPLCVILSLNITTFVGFKDLLKAERDAEIRKSVLANNAIPDSKKEEAIEKAISFTESHSSFGLVLIILPLILFFFLYPFAFWALFRLIVRSPIRYEQVLSIYSFSNVVEVPAWLFQSTLLVLTKSSKIQTGLNIFVNNPESIEYVALGFVDIFTVWLFILFALGSSILLRQPKLKVGIIIITIWLVWTSIKLLPEMLR